MKIRCRNCGTTYDRPSGTIREINRRHYCQKCGAADFEFHQPHSGADPAFVAGTAGAVVGGMVGGPVGALVGGVLGAIIGSGSK